MIRYFAIATVLVLAVVVSATAYVNRDLIKIKIASVYLPVPPKPTSPQAAGAGPKRAFRGDATWALSALPECVIQQEQVTGPSAFVLGKVPSEALVVRPPATLHFADCTISVVGDEAYVLRGSDRFHIPPIARFYRLGEELLLLQWRGRSLELRIYKPVSVKS